jgi:heterodisulfide reductase subunit C
MSWIQPVLFIAIFSSCLFYSFKRYRRIYANIFLGRAWTPVNSIGDRIKNMILIALGQKKMFSRPIPAIFHLFIYAAFVITQLELIEIIIDGVTGKHRVLGTLFYHLDILPAYTFVISFIEILSVLALIATFVFLSRRNLLKLPRLTMDELKGWPMKDANLILIGEIVLVTCIFMMNTGDQVMQQRNDPHYHKMGFFTVSQFLTPLLSGMSDGVVIAIERIGWWGHILGILGFLVYLPFSKHLHILLAFPNAFFSNPLPKGQMNAIPEITAEIKYMLDPTNPAPETNPDIQFGARDVSDLTWKNLLDAYSCTECGRCTSACPANLTGKKLSPRKIMMDTRDRMEAVGDNIAQNGSFVQDGKSLLHDYITEEELRACTTCNACVEECPVNISPLDIIMQLRRNLVMMESKAPVEWNNMFGNIENNGAPWKFSQQDRANWTN